MPNEDFLWSLHSWKHTGTDTHLPPVYERSHYVLVPHHCMSFPGCSLSYNHNNLGTKSHVLFCFFFAWLFSFCVNL